MPYMGKSELNRFRIIAEQHTNMSKMWRWMKYTTTKTDIRYWTKNRRRGWTGEMKHLADVDKNCYAQKLESSMFDEMIIDPTHLEQEQKPMH